MIKLAFKNYHTAILKVFYFHDCSYLPTPLSPRCPPAGLTSLDGVPAAADVLVHVAGHTAEEREAVRQSGGVYHHGDANRSGAHDFQADGTAPVGVESEGESS